jgi:N terminus of Rad21 / Rec8 like protein
MTGAVSTLIPPAGRNRYGSCADAVGCSDNIMQPEVPQALRLQGILMGGVVIIYSRQTHFLLEDCKEVMVRRLQCR